MRTCAGCGEDFEPAAKSSRARFHSEACRKAASRRRKAGMPTLVPSLPSSAELGDVGPIEAATRADLERWGKSGSVVAQLVLLMARRLDHSERDSGSGVAALAKVFTLYWGDLSAAAQAEDDNPLQELRGRLANRRDQRRLVAAPHVETLPDEPFNPDAV